MMRDQHTDPSTQGVGTTSAAPAVIQSSTPSLPGALSFLNLRKARAAATLRERRAPQPAILFTHVEGHQAVRDMRSSLADLAHSSGQIDSIADLSYFLEKPGLMRRIPHLILMKDADHKGDPAPAHHGALLIHEFRPFGVPSGVFATTDRSGRGVVLGKPQDRLRYALRAANLLLRKGAKMVLMTIQCDDEPSLAGWGRSVKGVEWAVRHRVQPSHLALAGTYEETLAGLGQKTRANLRYYRKRALSDLHCRFLPQIGISLQDLLDFNRNSSFPLPKRVLRWRLRVQSQLSSPYMVGLQDGDGRWLSVIGGRRFGDSTEILWQLNRSGLERHSIVTAMRSFHLEHEIAQGMKRFYVEGGTNHSMQHSFQTTPATDIVMIRSRLRAGMGGFARQYVPPDNVLADMLNDPTNDWRSS